MNHFIGQGKETLVRAVRAFDSRLLADASYPLISARGCVTRAPRLPVLEASRIHIVSSTEQRTEQSDFGLRRRASMHESRLEERRFYGCRIHPEGEDTKRKNTGSAVSETRGYAAVITQPTIRFFVCAGPQPQIKASKNQGLPNCATTCSDWSIGTIVAQPSDFRRTVARTQVEKCEQKQEMAERVGFEPTCQISLTIRFRVGAVMTASVPLRACRF